MNRPRLGFLGAGWIGRRRMEAIAAADAAKIVAIAEPDEAMARAAAQSAAPAAKLVSSLDDLFGFDLDGVVISTPSALHAEQTIAALRRGRAVFCQKPLGRNADEVSHIVGEARNADRLLSVDLSYRHVVGLRKIRDLVQAGELGDIFAADLVFHNAYGPQKPWFYQRKLAGGGCVIDLGIHLVDAALWILNQDVASVEGRVFVGGRPLDPASDEVEDYAVARIDLAGGAALNLTCSWRIHAGRDAVIEAVFFGTKGGAAMRNVNGSFLDFLSQRFSGTKSELLAEPPDDWGGRAAIDWARQIALNRRFDPEVEQQVRVAKVLDAIYSSSRLTR